LGNPELFFYGGVGMTIQVSCQPIVAGNSIITKEIQGKFGPPQWEGEALAIREWMLETLPTGTLLKLVNLMSEWKQIAEGI
jgi:hypothetical protein